MLRITQATVASEYSAITSVLLLLYSANTMIHISLPVRIFFSTQITSYCRLITSCANLSVSCDLHSGWYKYKTAIIINDKIIVALPYLCRIREKIQLSTPYT